MKNGVNWFWISTPHILRNLATLLADKLGAEIISTIMFLGH